MSESYYETLAYIYSHPQYGGRLPMNGSDYLIACVLTEFFAAVRLVEVARIATRRAFETRPIPPIHFTVEVKR